MSGAALTALVHLVMGVGLFSHLGGAWVADPIPNRALADVSQSIGEDTVMTVRFITESPSVEQMHLMKLLKASMDTELSLPTPEVQPPPGVETMLNQIAMQPVAGPGELPAAKTPQDIYLAQIRARIDRAWNDSKGRRFVIGKCRVGITQASSGTVTGVEFIKCLSTESWKQSLAQAIRYASPLPAPPDEAVFSEEVILEF